MTLTELPGALQRFRVSSNKFEKLIRLVVPKPYREKTLQRFRRALYRGNQYDCPCCLGAFSQFLPFGVKTRRVNAQCPGCNSLERHRLLWLYMQQRFLKITAWIDKPKTLLHIAPERIFQNLFQSLPNTDYVSLDLCCPRAMIHCDLEKITLPDSAVDFIFCNHVLEHVNNDRQAMRELFRVLKPGGFAVIQVPIDTTRQITLEDPAYNTPELRTEFYGQPDHLRMYGTDYPQRLEEAGFKVTPEQYAFELDPNDYERYRISPEIIYLCSKPESYF
ncbi:MAG: methyltransferase domain-containing protein [Cyanobacteria bacterium]|nr:methyltransferase domain-containing protein [Cyanobacteriota bacterium]